MKYNFLTRLLTLLLVAATLVACSKDELDEAKDNLTGGSSRTWKVTSSKEDGQELVGTDQLIEGESTFKKDGSYTFSQKLRLSSSLPVVTATVNGEWVLEDKGKILKTRSKKQDGTFSEYLTANVEELTGSALRISSSSNGKNYVTIYTRK
jgi:hypothetical protein